MEKTKSNRGGVREGAGRKRMGEELKASLTVRISPSALDRLESLATSKGISKGVYLEEMITRTYTDEEQERYINVNTFGYYHGNLKWLPKGMIMPLRLGVVNGVVAGFRTFNDLCPIIPIEYLNIHPRMENYPYSQKDEEDLDKCRYELEDHFDGLLDEYKKYIDKHFYI